MAVVFVELHAMNKKILIFLALNLLVIAPLAGLFYLAEPHPLGPASSLYRLQLAAESGRVRLHGGAAAAGRSGAWKSAPAGWPMPPARRGREQELLAT
jgi:hypothetical protein